MLTVEFQQPIGTVLGVRQFAKGSSVRVAGKSTGTFGGPNTFMPVRLEVFNGFTALFIESRTNAVGNYWFDITMPSTDTKATVRVTAWFPVGSPEVVGIPIAIGSVQPDPLPEVPAGGLLDIVPSVITLVVLMVMVSLMDVFGGKDSKRSIFGHRRRELR